MLHYDGVHFALDSNFVLRNSIHPLLNEILDYPNGNHVASYLSFTVGVSIHVVRPNSSDDLKSQLLYWELSADFYFAVIEWYGATHFLSTVVRSVVIEKSIPHHKEPASPIFKSPSHFCHVTFFLITVILTKHTVPHPFQFLLSRNCPL